MTIRPMILALLLFFTFADSIHALAYDETTISTFQIYTVDEAKVECKLHNELEQSLKENGFTKVMCPFAILLVADSGFSDELLKYGANLVANLIDKDDDGIVDDANVAESLAHRGKFNHGTSLVCGTSGTQERLEEKLRGLEGTFSCQTWKSGGNYKEKKAIMFEETFHMIHQLGWGNVYPDQLGYESFTSSVVCREMARLQCVSPGWWHPENTCPAGAPFTAGNAASSPLKGTCNDPSCDCLEFYRQAITLYTGWYDLPFWYSDYMPRSKEAFMDMASAEILNMMRNSLYNQPQNPLTGVYTNYVEGTNEGSGGGGGGGGGGNGGGGDSGDCQDDEFKKVKGKKTCKWVSKKSKKRCELDNAKLFCKSTCETCDDGDGEGGGNDGSCEDDGSAIIKGRNKKCPWVAKNPSKRCRSSKAKNFCKKSCNLCENDGGGGGGEGDDGNSGGGGGGDDGGGGGGGGGLNGEEACEYGNYGKTECLNISCCVWDEGQCWSAVGTGSCIR